MSAPAAAAIDDAQAGLRKAIKDRDPVAARAAIDAGADINAKGEFDRTPLHDAARESAEITALLIERGARLDPLDGDGRTPLHRAYADSAQLLLTHKADFLILDKSGNTALHIAAEKDAPMCKLLVDAGLPVDSRNNAGLTPLHFAALQAAEPVVDYLLAKGADINAKTLGPYSYKWSYIAWDVQGMEVNVPTNSTPLSIVKNSHSQTKWSSGRYAGLLKSLPARGAIEDKSPPNWIWTLASPITFVLFFWGLFHVDAQLRGWGPLAERYSATSTPATIDAHQDGSVGTVGAIQLRKMLRAAATETGLYIAMPKWVLAAHPPLLIPWQNLRIEQCRRGITGAMNLHLRTDQPATGRILLSGGVADAVLAKVDPGFNCGGQP